MSTKLTEFIANLQKIEQQSPGVYVAFGQRNKHSETKPLELPIEISMIFDNQNRPHKVLLLYPKAGE